MEIGALGARSVSVEQTYVPWLAVGWHSAILQYFQISMQHFAIFFLVETTNVKYDACTQNMFWKEEWKLIRSSFTP